MKFRDAFNSKVAVAALALSLAQGSAALAQEAINVETPHNPAPANTWSVTINPLVPVGVIAGLGLLYGGFCLLAGRRHMKGAWLGAAAGGIISLALINPEILQEERESLPTEVIVVVDKTASQSIDGRDSTTEETYAALARQLSEIDGVNIRRIEVKNSQNGQNGDGTNLFGAIDAGLSDVPRDRLGAVIMLTDGQIHDISDSARAPVPGVPFHVLISGRENEYDRRIVVDQAPRFGVIDKNLNIRFRVLDAGAIATKDKARVIARSEGKTLETLYVTPGEPAEMSVDISHTGSNVVELTTDFLDGELTGINNRIVTSIEGVREHLNVLLVSGKPNPDTRALRNLLKSDSDINLVHFTITRPPEKRDPTPLKELSLIPVPVNEIFSGKMDKFDLIVFDSYEDRGLLAAAYFNNIANRVKKGGSLLVISGPDYAGIGSLYRTPLSAVLPASPTGHVTEEAYTPHLNELGKRHPVTRSLAGSDASPVPWGRWFRLADTDKSSGHVVMEGAGDKPLLILDRKGNGRVAMLQSDSSWLWARGYEGGGPHGDMMRNITHWLIKDPVFEEEGVRLINKDGKLVIEQQTMFDESTSVTVRTPSGKEIKVMPERAAPGIWHAEIPAYELGIYSAVRDGNQAAHAFISIGPANPREFVDAISTSDLLKPLADQTGGRIARMTDEHGHLTATRIVAKPSGKSNEDMSGPGWIGIRMTDASTLKGVEHAPLIPLWVSLTFIVGLLAATWYRQGDGRLFRKETWQKNAVRKNNNDGPSP